jgi:endoglucanase Acf2
MNSYPSAGLVLTPLRALILTATLLAGPVALSTAHAQPVALGAGAYHLKPQGSDPAAPAAPHRSGAMAQRAVPTNQWYSSVLFSDKPEPLYAQPLSLRPVGTGFEVALPRKAIVPTERKDVEVHYTHQQALLVSAVAQDSAPAAPATVSNASDWAVDLNLSRAGAELRVTVAHGSPYAAFEVSRGNLRLRLPSAGERIPTPEDERILALRIGGMSYAAFGPTGVRWQQASPTEWIAHMPEGKGYLSVAGLPDELGTTRALLSRHAYAFLQDTRVSWHYDRPASQVVTTFNTAVRTLEGPDVGPLLALYPHHWHNNPKVADRLGPAYDTVRGPLKLLAARSFEVITPYRGFVPYWPALQAEARQDELKDIMKIDVRNARRMMLEIGNGSYWQGKGLQRITKLLDVVEVQGDKEARQQLLQLLQKRIESWFSGQSNKTYFHLDSSLGTVLAYPEEYFSIEQMNDHHFHYGYWIRAMAEIALRDPAWAAKDRWGGMVDLLVADIATPQRGRKDFPFLRNFDVYEGHSWASGNGMNPWGNNQESSSEAINAWAGLILWAEVTGNTSLRDLGIYLYTSEIEAISHYWFDIHRLVFAPEYRSAEVSMVFGGKYAHNTWWIDEPRQIKGINLLPITTASAYLARDPAFVKRSVATLPEETRQYESRGRRADPPDIWQDLFAKYLALADPQAGLNAWNRWGAVEFGDSRTHALHFMLSLQTMGPPDLSMGADTPLHAVFKRADGGRTYLVYNVGSNPISVRFTDGQVLEVPPHQLAVHAANVKKAQP